MNNLNMPKPALDVILPVSTFPKGDSRTGQQRRNDCGWTKRNLKWQHWPLFVALSFLAAIPTARAQEGPTFTDPNAACYAADGVTVVCDGDWSAGIFIDNVNNETDFEKLFIDYEVATGVTPADGTNAILFHSDTTDILIDADQVKNDLVVNVDGQAAIDVKTNAVAAADPTESPGDIRLHYWGDITNNSSADDSRGISLLAEGVGSIEFQHTGHITASGHDGVLMETNQGGWIDAYIIGNITSDSQRGIRARVYGAPGTITITYIGNLQGKTGLSAQTFAGGHITLTTTGNIIGGMFANVKSAMGNITITHRGNVHAGGYGIDAFVSDGANGLIYLDIIGDFYVGKSNPQWSDGIYAGEQFTARDTITSTVFVRHVGTIINYSSDGSRGIEGPNGIEISLLDGGTGQVFYTGEIHTVAGAGISVNTNYDNLGEGTITLGQTASALDGTPLSGTVISSREGKGIWQTARLHGHLNFYNAVTIVGLTHDILAVEGDEIINNYGTFTSPGEIDLGDGANFFNNRAGATFNSGDVVDLGEQSIDQDVAVFVDSEGYAVQTDDGVEDTPEGLIEDTVPGNTFFNAGDISPGGIEFKEVQTWEDDPETVDEDEEEWRTVQRGIQTTTLTGNFIMKETGTYTVTVNDDGQSDLLQIIGGTTTLDGNGWVRVYARTGYDFGGDYTILEAEALIGEFAGVRDTAFVDHELDYSEANKVKLTSEKLHSPCSIANTDNHRSLACDGLTSMFIDPDTLATDHELFQLILQMETADEVRAAYDMLTGELHPSVSSLLMQDSALRSDAVLQRLHRLADRKEHTSYGLLTDARAAAEGALAALKPDDWWFEARGSLFERDADTGIGTAELDHEASGFLIGADHSYDGWVIGVAGGQSIGETDIDDRFSDADTQTWSFGMYGSGRVEAAQDLPLHFSFGAFTNWHTIDTSRTVAFDNFHEELEADYDATSFQAFAEIGTHVDVTDDLFVHPFASVSHISMETDGFTETAVGDSTASTALTADNSSQSLTTTTLGLRSGIMVDRLNLHGMIGWRHGFGDVDPETESSFAGSDKFTIIGSPIAEDALITEFSIGTDLAPGITFAAIYRGQLAEDSQAHSLNASLSGRF